MTGRERTLAVLAGQMPDYLPFMPITMMFTANIFGVKYGKYVRDGAPIRSFLLHRISESRGKKRVHL